MSDSKSGGGLGIAGVLLIVFVVLKLVGVISWKWIWVLSPLWLGVAYWIVFVILAAIGVAIFSDKRW